MYTNQDDLKTLYNRAEQYAIARFSKSFDRLMLGEDGLLILEWDGYERGDEDQEYVDVESLTDDLDILVAERKAAEEARKVREAEERRIRDIKDAAYKKQQRFSNYLALQKEFG